MNFFAKLGAQQPPVVLDPADEKLLPIKGGRADVPVIDDLPGYEENAEISPLEGMQFKFPLRKYQQEILELTRTKLARGERALHIVAPPGAGKTIIGLQIVCELKEPALIISPTTTIQAQWGEKLDLFLPPDAPSDAISKILGTHEDKPLKPITLLTYQVLSTTSREQEYLEKLAHQAWVDELVAGTTNSMGAAELRILELLQNNKKAYDKEISRHITRLRRKLTNVLDLKEVLHPNALGLIQAMRRQKFKVVIFDECHHLTDYWAAIMGQVVRQLDAPLVIGLTGTPPEGKSAGQETRYMNLVGDIDYQVPTPALVREGGLAPFQDLVLFTRPTETEEQFLELQHHAFHDLLIELTCCSDIGAGEKFRQRSEELKAALKDAEQLLQDCQAKNRSPVDDIAIDNSSDLEQSALAAQNVAAQSPTISELAAIDIDAEYADEMELLYSSDSVSFSPTCDASATDQSAGAEHGNSSEIEVDREIPPPKAASKQKSRKDKPVVSAPARRNKNQDRSLPEPSIAEGEPKTISSDQPPDPATSLLTRWVKERLASASVENWDTFIAKEPELCAALCRYSWKFELELPDQVELSNDIMQAPLFIDDWMIILEDFALNYLKLSASAENHELYERIRQAITKLGYGLTERGLRKQASPVDRVLAFSRSKSRAVAEILQVEYQNLGDRLRAVVVTDFEKMSATASRSVKGILSEESGGAIAVLKDLLADPVSEKINPCLVTGSIILIDNRIGDEFLSGINGLLKQEGYNFQTTLQPVEGESFSQLGSTSAEWESRIYVGLATTLLAKGVSKVLVGTRGIFGEGWDCQALNTLVDLTTTTTPMSVKQLRGRSIRINTSDPLGSCKVANNWDVVCIAPHLEKGLNDYQRFVRKHEGFFGVCDDGQIESGVGHVHPSFSELTPAEVFAGSTEFNIEMKTRALHRESIYELWKVGRHYSNVTISCAEITGLKQLNLSPPSMRQSFSYHDHCRLLRANLGGVWLDFSFMALAAATATYQFCSLFKCSRWWAVAPVVLIFLLGTQRFCHLYQKLKLLTCHPRGREAGLRDIGIAVLKAMQKQKLIPRIVPTSAVQVTTRSNGSLRVFLDTADPEHATQFVKCVKEAIEPIKSQPFLVAKFEYLPEAEPEQRKQAKVQKAADRTITQQIKLALSSVQAFSLEQRENAPKTKQLAPSPKGKKAAGDTTKSKSRLAGKSKDERSRVKSRKAAKGTSPSEANCRTNKKMIQTETIAESRTIANAIATLLRAGAGLLARTAVKCTTSSISVAESLSYFFADKIISLRTKSEQGEDAQIAKYESQFFQKYLKGEAELKFSGYYVVPSVFAKSAKGRQEFQQCWNQYVSPGEIFSAESKKDVIKRYFGKGAVVSRRVLWE